jgi:TrmH family RNA methyltransferase
MNLFRGLCVFFVSFVLKMFSACQSMRALTRPHPHATMTAMITSVHNPKIQWLHKLQSQSKARREEGAFVVEGVRLAEEALQAGWPALLVLHSEQLSLRGQAVVDGFAQRGTPVETATEPVLKAASDTETPQGLLVALKLQTLPLPPNPDFVLIPDGVRDPGNLGTLLRTAAAAGAQAVLLPPGTADDYAPKVLRSAMGAHFRLAIQALDWPAIQGVVHSAERQLRVYLADSSGGQPYTQADLRTPLALIVGGEAAGASQQAIALTNERLHIPMPGGMESLNAAVAAAILMFEVVRQRQTVSANPRE